jgi:hypothetical protein
MVITNSRLSYLPRAGLYIGIVGAVNFIVFVLFYLEDWTHRFSFMVALIPIPFISLFLARKKLFIGGVLLIALGVAALLIDINLSIGIVGQIAGVGLGHTVGLGYTIIFVSLPLLVSGILFLLSGRTRRKTIRKSDS